MSRSLAFWIQGVPRQILVIIFFMCCVLSARAESLEDQLHTVWESLWNQEGVPLPVQRWEQDIRFRFVAPPNLSHHRDQATKALRTAAEVAAVNFTDVTDSPQQDQANLIFRIESDGNMPDNMPCFTQRLETRAFLLQKVQIKAKSNDVWRCSFHEAMHAMGIPGHPSGKTVLSYFPWRRDELMAMDKVMLRAWYSPRMKAGMTPFEALDVLADEVIQTMAPDDPEGRQLKERYFSGTVKQMRAFVDGQGEVPRIVLRSGRASGNAIQFGQAQMAYFLGMAYLKGSGVSQSNSEALRLLEIGALKKHLPAQLALASAWEKGLTGPVDEVEAYKWFGLADAQRPGAGKVGMERLASKLTEVQLEDAKRRVTDFR